MDSAYPGHHRDTAILMALAQCGTAAWCFVPADRECGVLCSRVFGCLWNVAACSDATSFSQPRQTIIQAMSRQGVESAELLGLIASSGPRLLSVFSIVRSDLQRLQVEITPIVASTNLIGHLIQFQENTDASVFASLLQEFSGAQKRLEVLSPREREILLMIYEGRTNKSISIATRISEKTVEKHRARIMQKLEVNCPAQLFRLVSKAWMVSDTLKRQSRVSDGSALESSSWQNICPSIACDGK